MIVLVFLQLLGMYYCEKLGNIKLVLGFSITPKQNSDLLFLPVENE